MGKGDKTRPTDETVYRDNYDDIFRKKAKPEETVLPKKVMKVFEDCFGKSKDD